MEASNLASFRLSGLSWANSFENIKQPKKWDDMTPHNCLLKISLLRLINDKNLLSEKCGLSEMSNSVCCSSALRVPETPLYVWSWMALLIFWQLGIKACSSSTIPVQDRGFLKKRYGKQLYCWCIVLYRSSGEISFRFIELRLLTRLNSLYPQPCSNVCGCFERFLLDSVDSSPNISLWNDYFCILAKYQSAWFDSWVNT